MRLKKRKEKDLLLLNYDDDGTIIQDEPDTIDDQPTVIKPGFFQRLKKKQENDRYEEQMEEEHEKELDRQYYEMTSGKPANLSVALDIERNHSKTTKEKVKQPKKRKGITESQRLAMQQINKVENDGFDSSKMIEMDEEPESIIFSTGFKIATAIVVVIGIFLFGYFETEYNAEGQPVIVSLETRKERRYVTESDKLLQEIIDSASYIQPDTANPNNFVAVTETMNYQKNRLLSLTDDVSRYVDVPEAFSAYHQKLLNVSLGVQKLQQEILDNYQESDYLAWRAESIAEMVESIEQLHQMRVEIDSRIWNLE